HHQKQGLEIRGSFVTRTKELPRIRSCVQFLYNRNLQYFYRYDGQKRCWQNEPRYPIEPSNLPLVRQWQKWLVRDSSLVKPKRLLLKLFLSWHRFLKHHQMFLPLKSSIALRHRSVSLFSSHPSQVL